MSHPDPISTNYPELAKRLGKESLATLPTPVRTVDTNPLPGTGTLTIKCDNLTGSLYGGNKVRKLEYALRPARDRGRKKIATFGAIGSNHALATALYAKSLGYECTCFLSHQRASAKVAETIRTQLANGTKIVRYGGAYTARIATLRENLWNQDCWVIPAGGSSWLGTIGFVNAGLELAAQIKDNELPEPDRIYIATGTMGSAAGLAIGLAMAGVEARVEAVRVSMTSICNEALMQRLINKTVAMMTRIDSSVSANLTKRVNIHLRDSYFAGGYAHSDKATDEAVQFAADELGLGLETTYTGKAMAALLNDTGTHGSENVLFWNTYNSQQLSAQASDTEIARLPQEFHRYLEAAGNPTDR